MNRPPVILIYMGQLCAAASALAAAVSIAPATTLVAQGQSAAFTVSVSPSTHVQEVRFEYEGETGMDVVMAAPFTVTHPFNQPRDGLIVTATVIYTNGDPPQQVSARVDVVGLTVLGPMNPGRGWLATYNVQSNPAGKSISQVAWTFTGPGAPNTLQNQASWSGKMIVSGTLSVSAVVSGAAVQTNQVIAVSSRNWSTPISCAQDNDPDFGEVPVPSAELGMNRDMGSQVRHYIFGPRNGATDFAPARTLAEVTTGPCAGWWYVAGSTLRCQRETVINRYILANGPLIDSRSFYQVNSDCFSTSVDNFIQAVGNHEYRGTPDTPGSTSGHQGRLETAILEQWHDPRKAIEPLVNRNPADLADAVNGTILAHEASVLTFFENEVYQSILGPNWGGVDGLGVGMNSRVENSTWSECVNDPGYF